MTDLELINTQIEQTKKVIGHDSNYFNTFYQLMTPKSQSADHPNYAKLLESNDLFGLYRLVKRMYRDNIKYVKDNKLTRTPHYIYVRSTNDIIEYLNKLRELVPQQNKLSGQKPKVLKMFQLVT